MTGMALAAAGSGIDWTTVLTALIASVPAIIGALAAVSVRRQIRLPSGKKIGEAVEYAHDTAIANNMLLRKSNGQTQEATRAGIADEGSRPPQVPREG